MAKVRIFSLAKELGLANKELIAMAADAGIEVKNSALASVTTDVADQIRGLAAGGAKPAVAVKEPPKKAAPPRRERPADREIRDLRTVPTPGFRNPGSAPAGDAEQVAEAEAVAEVDAVAAPEEAAAESSGTETVTTTDDGAVDLDGAKPSDPAPVQPVTAETPVAEEEPSVVEKIVDVASKTASDAAAKVGEVAETATETVSEKAAAATEAATEKAAEVVEAAKTTVAQAAGAAKVVAAETADAVKEKAAEVAAAVTPADEQSEAKSDDAVTPAAAEKPADEAVKKSDYVDPTGAGKPGTPPKRKRPGLMRPRQMQAVGTVRKPRGPKQKDGDDQGPPKSGDKPKAGPKKPTLPNIAMPTFKGPVGGEPKSDEPAQKPDVKLGAEFLNSSSPLADRIKAEKDRRSSDTTSTPGARTPRRGPTSFDAIRQNRSRAPKRGFVNSDDRIRRQGGRRKRKRVNPADLKTSAVAESPVTIRELSEAIGRPAKDIISFFWKQGDMTKNVNSLIEDEAAEEVSLELGVELTFKDKQDLEEDLIARMDVDFDGLMEEDETSVFERPPIITILGHVDHGKTTLVDTLRQSSVTKGEAGGITQHIAAYQVQHEDRTLTFVDTPGHAAFGAMRARGADVTDIIVLVVAADDGVMPQTVESIAHAKESGKPIVVAMNKMDLPDANEQKVLTDLSQHGLQPQEWGGNIEVVRVSALAGTGIDDLLETLLLTAEVEELKGTQDIEAHGICLEGFRDEGRGAMAWAIVQQGELNIGDNVVIGNAYGRVRALYDEYDQELEFAGPSMPVKIAGLNDVPTAGVRMFEVDEIDDARELAERRVEQKNKEKLLKRGTSAKTIEQILAGEGAKELPIIIKADTPGSVEAITGELEKFEHDEVGIRIIHDGTGGVNGSDVYLAATAGASILAFNVVPEDEAASLADKEGVEIRRYSIIYELLDDIRNALEGLLEPERREVATGRAIVLQTFSISRMGTVAGCRILSGTIERNNRMHVIRDQTVVGTYTIGSLRREKDDVKEVREGMECGIRLENFNDVKDGDLLEGFRVEEIARTLD